MSAPSVAIVGAGWAGLAAAVEATRRGCRVTLIEATRVPGGRSRSLSIALPDGGSVVADNGQHILIGAYAQTLALMQHVGADPRQLLHPMPLALEFPDGGGLRLPDWPAPLDLLAGIGGAHGWSWADKASLLRTTLRWKRMGFSTGAGETVAQLCAGLAPRPREELMEPLCVAALNTPADRASANVFLRVLHDALLGPGFGGWKSSQLLLTRVPLGAVFPEPAVRWLSTHGARVEFGKRIDLMAPATDEAGWMVDGERFDEVVLACSATEASRLAQPIAPAWAGAAAALPHESIATVYLHSARRLARPLLALRSSPQAPAQFVFDRGQLDGPHGLLAFVVSASEGDRGSIERQVLAQAHALGWTDARPVQTVVDRRATFSCVPGLRRPAMAVTAGLWACGDYVDGPYPATLEGAVRSGIAAAQAITPTARTAP